MTTISTTGRRGTETPGETEAPPRLAFRITGADVAEHAAVPSLRFGLHIDAAGAEIRSLALHCQLFIVAPARQYTERETARLYELFGAPRDWARSLRRVTWAQAGLVVPAFTGAVDTQILVPCSYDFDVAATKYLDAIRDGVIPLEFQYAGSLFYRGPEGNLRTARLPWDGETRYDMPARLWRDTMDRYFPNSAWLRVSRAVFDRLIAWRSDHGLPTWDATLEDLLGPAARRPGGQP